MNVKFLIIFLNPLEQFEIFPWFRFLYLFTISNIFFYFLFLIASVFVFLFAAVYSQDYIPRAYQYLNELLYTFIVKTVKQQVDLFGLTYFPLFYWTFFFVIFSNLLGLVPFSFTVTSQILITFLMAFSFNLGLILIGFYLHGLDFFHLFIPKGAPVYLLPLIVTIELISYLLRTFSLSIRLAANMMAGHTLLHILSTFVLMFLKSKNLYFIAIFPGILVLLAMGLELGIALLQAYVFFILLTLYFNDSATLGGH